MKEDLYINPNLHIKGHELEITASRAGGPGGQHVNKTSSRITVRWNVVNSGSLSYDQKQRIATKLASELSSDGDLIVSNGSSRSQLHNKKAALNQLAEKIRAALIIPKKRKRTKIPKEVKEKRLKSKRMRSAVKHMRQKKSYDE